MTSVQRAGGCRPGGRLCFAGPAGKGYRLDTDPDGCVVAIGIADGLRYAAALSWREMLSWVLAAPKLGDGAK